MICAQLHQMERDNHRDFFSPELRPILDKTFQNIIEIFLVHADDTANRKKDLKD